MRGGKGGRGTIDSEGFLKSCAKRVSNSIVERSYREVCARVGWRHVVKVFWGSFGKGVAESGTAEDFGGASKCWREVLGMITVKGRLKSKVQT